MLQDVLSTDQWKISNKPKIFQIVYYLRMVHVNVSHLVLETDVFFKLSHYMLQEFTLSI